MPCVRPLFAIALCVLACLHAAIARAATVESIVSRVSVNRGAGFKEIFEPTTVSAGNTVMASHGGRAEIVYSEDCRVEVKPGKVVPVYEEPPCDEGLVTDEAVRNLVIKGLVKSGVASAILEASQDYKPVSP